MENLRIGLDDFNKLIEMAENKGIIYEIYEGSLLDNAILYHAKDLGLKGYEHFEYIIIIERYLTSWSSDLEIIGTSDINEVHDYEELFEE